MAVNERAPEAAVGFTDLVVIAQKLVQKVQSFGINQVLILRAHELCPGLAAMPPDQLLQLRIELQAILIQVVK